jgi:hypothetical protein
MTVEDEDVALDEVSVDEGRISGGETRQESRDLLDKMGSQGASPGSG